MFRSRNELELLEKVHNLTPNVVLNDHCLSYNDFLVIDGKVDVKGIIKNVQIQFFDTQ